MFRTLPERVRTEDLVETSDVQPSTPEETELQRAWRGALLGAGG